MTDDKSPNEKLRLVADNDPARIAERQKQAAVDDARDKASTSLAALVVHLLRVFAGAGQPHAVPNGLIEAAEHYRGAYDAGHRGQMPGLEELTLYHLFKEGRERNEPQTEEEWRRWATDDPDRDYQEERRSLLNQLRRHVLREIASTIAGSDLQIRREEREIDDVLRRLEQARDNYFKRPREPRSLYRRNMAERQIAKLRGAHTEPQRAVNRKGEDGRLEKPKLDTRQEIADTEIEKLQVQKRDEMIAGLKQPQWVALYAIHSGDAHAFETTNAFIFDVLARMKLLKRKPDSGKTKRDWQLTELGMLAMSRAPSTILDNSQR